MYPPFTSSINDKISSVNASNLRYVDPAVTQSPFVILFEHINRGGAQLWLHSRGGPEGVGYYRNLGVFGWNDMASSMRYY